MKYPVDGFLSYIYHSDNKLHIKIIQYQSIYYHGHTKKCFMINTAAEKIKVEKTSLVSHEIARLCNHLLNPVVFEYLYIEISDCDFVEHNIPKIKDFVPFYRVNYDLKKKVIKALDPDRYSASNAGSGSGLNE